MANFLDKTGLSYFWEKIKAYVKARGSSSPMTVNDVDKVLTVALSEDNKPYAYWKELSGSESGKMTSITGTAFASSWDGSPSTNTVSVPDLPANVSGFIGLSNNATEEQRIAARNAILFPINQGEGTVTIVADGQTPTVDLPIMVYYLQNVEWVEPEEDTLAVYETITLTVDGWTEYNKQTVSISTILGDETKQLIQPVAATSSKEEYEECGVQCIGQTEGTLVFHCLDIPRTDLTVYVVITELMPS